MQFKKSIQKLSSLLLISLLFSTSISAQDLNLNQNKTALTISPTISEIVLEGGETSQKEITIQNLTNQPIPIKVIKQGLSLQDKQQLSQEEVKRFDASSWITIEDGNSDFILGAKQSKQVLINVTPPSNATPGGHYSSIIFEPLIPQEFLSTKSVNIYTRVSATLFMIIKGEIIQDLEILSLNGPTLSDSTDFEIGFSVKNKGNTHILPSAKIDVYNQYNNEKVSTFNITPSFILPGNQKDFIVKYDKPIGLGQYYYVATASFGTPVLTLESERKHITIIPGKNYVLIFLAIVIFLIIVLFLRKRFSKAFKILFSK